MVENWGEQNHLPIRNKNLAQVEPKVVFPSVLESSERSVFGTKKWVNGRGWLGRLSIVGSRIPSMSNPSSRICRLYHWNSIQEECPEE